MTPLINAYMNRYKSSAASTTQTQKQIPAVLSQDSLRTNVKAYPPQGRLVRTNIFNVKDVIQSDINSIKYFFNGIQGKGNDYSVGKINDVALKLGSLGIAGIIASGKGSSFQKGMEFVGFGFWFLAMSLWPKLAINTPIKLLKGVDLNAQYVTSRGDKKNFYQDPQFLCWDLVSDEEINKMGDKLGIPKDIKNRRQAIENKAKQVAIQGNTLSLLTAGFATPLIASLAADKVGKLIVKPALVKVNNSSLPSLQSPTAHELNNNLSSFINNISGENIDGATIKQIKDAFYKEIPLFEFKEEVEKTIDNIFTAQKSGTSEINIDEKLGKEILNKILSTGIIPSDNQAKVSKLEAILTELNTRFNNRLVNENKVNDYLYFLNKKLADKGLVRGNIQKFDTIKNEVFNLFETKKSINNFSISEAKEKLTKLAKILSTYNKNIDAQYTQNYFNKYWAGELSTNAKDWEIVPKTILRAINPSDKLLTQLIQSPSEKVTSDVMMQITEEFLNKDDKTYEKAMKQIIEVVSPFAEKNPAELNKVLKYLDDTEKLLTSFTSEKELANISNIMSTSMAHHRRNIFSKIISKNNTFFSPMQTISLLKDAKNNPDIDYETLKALLMENQTVDAFINKFNNFRKIIKDAKGNIISSELAIKNQAEFDKYINYIFKTPESLKKLLPENAIQNIENSNNLLKVLLVSQNDGVNKRFNISSRDEIIKAFKDNNLEKYFDDFFEFSLASKDDLLNWVMYKLTNEKSKLEQLKQMLVLQPHELSELDSIFANAAQTLNEGEANQVRNIITRHFNAEAAFSKGYFDNAKGKAKALMNFFDISNLDELKEIKISRAYTGATSCVTAKPINHMIKDTAKDLLTYNKWFKRVGIAFVALCGITAIGIACIGKKNEFNQDIYTKKVGA